MNPYRDGEDAETLPLCWTSPLPADELSNGTTVRALTSAKELSDESMLMNHCVGLYDWQCIDEPALHVYVLEGPGEERSTLGVTENSETGEWRILDHRIADDLPEVSDIHRQLARAMRAGFEKHLFANGYDRDAAAKRRAGLTAANRSGWSEEARAAARRVLIETMPGVHEDGPPMHETP